MCSSSAAWVKLWCHSVATKARTASSRGGCYNMRVRFTRMRRRQNRPAEMIARQAARQRLHTSPPDAAVCDLGALTISRIKLPEL